METANEQIVIEALSDLTDVGNLRTHDDGTYGLSVDADQDLTAIRDALPGWSIEYCGEGNTDANGDSTEDICLAPPADD